MRTIGILALETEADRFDRSLAHPATFDCTVIEEKLTGVWVPQILEGSEALTPAFVDAARRLEERGADLIISNCGFTVLYRRAMEQVTKVPIATSSLQLLPVLDHLCRRNARIGVATFDGTRLTERHWRAAWPQYEAERVVVADIHGTDTWQDWCQDSPKYDFASSCRDIDVMADRLAQQNVDVVLLECAVFTAFARRIAARVNKPVFDLLSLVDLWLPDAVSDRRSSVHIRSEDLTSSIADALQFISYTHPRSYIQHLCAAWEREQSAPAKAAMAQILVNSRMALLGRRPICQDTGLVNVFLKIGRGVRIDGDSSLQQLVDEGVRRAYLSSDNPLRPSVVASPLFERRNTGDNTPAAVHVELVEGNDVEITVAAKGGGSENKARFAVLLPSDDVASWVVDTVSQLGAGWCPPGVLGIGVGGTAEQAMLSAKQALTDPIDMNELLARGAATPFEKLRVEIYSRVNALGIGAQGLGGLTTVLDVKIKTLPSHAASLPVALIPNCAADRHITFSLDGTGPATFEAPDAGDWPQIVLEQTAGAATRVDLNTLTREAVQQWRVGQTLLLSGRLLSARDAAHKRLATLHASGSPLPVSLAGRLIYYMGPVDPVRDEVIGPAGPTTASRLDGFLELTLEQGVLATIGKGERGPVAIDAIRSHGAASLVAVGGAAYLISKAIRSSSIRAFPDLAMEAIRELEVLDFPVIVAVDSRGRSIHDDGPLQWREQVLSRR